MTTVALVFPGQGSQASGMAAGLVDTPTGRELLSAASGEGLDLLAALQGDDDALRPTEIAQPALVFTELVLASLLPGDLDVVGVAGHSVGEYAAVSVAGGLGAPDALRLVIARGRAMAAMTEGTMAAVLGLDNDQVEAACAAARDAGHVVVVANFNAPGQVVISGTADGVAAAGDAAKAAGARRVLPLNVSGAFHSPLMHDAAAGFAERLSTTPLQTLRLPVVTNVDAGAVTDPAELSERMRRQLESPVRWTDCIATLVGLGAEQVVEVGPGAVLTGLMKRIDPAVPTATVSSADAARSFTATVGAPA